MYVILSQDYKRVSIEHRLSMVMSGEFKFNDDCKEYTLLQALWSKLVYWDVHIVHLSLYKTLIRKEK